MEDQYSQISGNDSVGHELGAYSWQLGNWDTGGLDGVEDEYSFRRDCGRFKDIFWDRCKQRGKKVATPSRKIYLQTKVSLFSIKHLPIDPLVSLLAFMNMLQGETLSVSNVTF